MGESCSALHGDWQDCPKVGFLSIFTQTKDQSTNGNSVTWSHKRKMMLVFPLHNKSPSLSISNSKLLLYTQNLKMFYFQFEQLFIEFLLSVGP